MSTLYDPRVSAACLALREDPPAALDGPILQYARDALAAAEVLRNADPMVWRRRTFAAIVAFIGVVSVASLWELWSPPTPQAEPPAPVAEPVVAIAPVAILPVAEQRLEATPPVAKPKPVAVTKKRSIAPVERKAAPPATPSAAIPDEPVSVKTLAVDDALMPEPIAPPAPVSAVEATGSATDPCVADPQAAGCTPPL